MAEDNKETKKSGEFRVPPRTWILWIAIMGAIPLLFLFKDPRDNPELLSDIKFLQYFHSDQIKEGVIWWDAQSPFMQEITGKYTPAGKDTAVKFRTKVHIDDALERQFRRSGKFEGKQPNTLVQNMLMGLLPF